MSDRCNEIKEDCLTRKEDCLTRIRALRVLLDYVEKSVTNDDGILNDLGELQGVPGILDCRLASLSVARRFRDAK